MLYLLSALVFWYVVHEVIHFTISCFELVILRMKVRYEYITAFNIHIVTYLFTSLTDKVYFIPCSDICELF